MLKSNIIDVGSDDTYSVSYFDDDTIETMRVRIANVVNSHPDRLFILVGSKFKYDYYQKDRRRWERLFKRLSYNDSPVDQIPFQEYMTTYRSPPLSIRYDAVEKSRWMSKPPELEEIYAPTREFIEYRLLGVDEVNSYILPLNFNNPGISKIPSAQIALPSLKSLLSSFHAVENIVHFKVLRYTERAENVAPYYFPALTASTPVRLSDETVGLLDKNTKLLNDLLALDINEPSSVNITHLRLYAEFVDTDFGSAARTRFEQIFYGVTMSEEVPCVTYFTSQGEVSRHKFFVKNQKTKKPEIDFPVWKRWASRLPYRNQPTLIFYRGDDDKVYDRISITPTDIVITLFRETKKNTKTVDQMKKEVLKWLKKFDAVMAFVSENDIDEDAWEAQNIQFSAKYGIPIEKIDTRRLNCVSSLFNRVDRDSWVFNILRTDRTDRTNSGITPVEMKIIQMKTEGVVRPNDVAKELNISPDDAKRILEDVERKLEENPNLADRAFKGFPSVELKHNELIALSVTDIDRIVKYGSMLRYIVGYPDDAIDRICPKRMEKVSIDTGVAPQEDLEVDQGFADQYGDIFGYLDEGAPAEKPAEEELPPEETDVKNLSTKEKTSLYGYFISRLLEFDRDTFETKGSDKFDYPKKCQQPYQPIIMSEEDLKRVDGLEFDPKALPENQKLEVESPNGIAICPEYWCSRDEIPLTKEQLELIDGEPVCPLCFGKIRKSDKDNPREYTVYKRTDGFIYPGYLKDEYRSSKTGKLMPCCKTKPMTPDKIKTDDKYYIVLEGKSVKDLRISYLKEPLLNSLNITQEYELFKKSNNRIANGMGGFFRIGLGRPSKHLPGLLGLKSKIPSPHEVPELALKCSFVRTWKGLGEKYTKTIETSLKKSPPYDTDAVSREALSAILSGISEAYETDKLSLLEELEYVAVVLQIDVFRIFTKSNTLGCLFYSQMVKPRTRGIIVLQDGNVLDLIGYVTRVQRDFSYRINVFEAPFTPKTYSVLESLRSESCKTEIPNYSTALGAMRDILAMSGKDDFQVILDPYGRGQSFYIPGHMILPFQPVALPDMKQIKRLGFSSIDSETIPKYTDVRKYLELAEKYSDGYAWVEDLYNNDSNRVEILLKSGLRIPVYPEAGPGTGPAEVIETTTTVGENELVFGNPSQQLETDYKQISYSSEIYEFLVYQLTKDLREKDDDLRSLLLVPAPKPKHVEPVLRKWFDSATEFISTKDPINFVSKIRRPCGQFTSKSKCTGTLCGWDGKTCKIQVRESVNKEKLFHRLLTTLVDNSKIRAMILDGRTSPFFTTVLFLELPNELILTSLDIVNVVI
jgi:hypothetical protein